MSFIAIFTTLLIAWIAFKLVLKFLKVVVLTALMAAIGFLFVTQGDTIRSSAMQLIPIDVQTQIQDLF